MPSDTKINYESAESTHLLITKATLIKDSTHTQYKTYDSEKQDDEKETICGDVLCISSISSVKEKDKGLDIKAEKKGPVSRLKGLVSGVSRRNLFVLFLCALANFLSTSAFSLIAPFFPTVARKKGMELTTIGLVFSLYQLGGIITSPIIGNYLNRIGVKFVHLSGLFVTSIAVICFGVLEKGPDGTLFTVMCILCRCVESLGASAFTTAGIAIVSSEFPNHMGTALAILNTGSSLGIMLGPLIGGKLYSVGGFGLPFYVTAGLCLMDAMFIYLFLPPLQHVGHNRSHSILAMIRNVRILVPAACVVIGIGGIGIYDATFAILLEPFKLSITAVGAFYLIASGVHTLMSPFWGFVTDRASFKEPMIIYGLFVFGLGFMFSGPSPLLPFVPFELWSVGLGFTLLGFSLGSVTITTLACMAQGAHDSGYDQNIDTNAMISGLYYSGYALGGFVGPLVGSLLVQQYGFPVGFTILGLTSIAVMLFVLGYFLIRLGVSKQQKKRQNVSTIDNITSGESNNLEVHTANI